MRRKQVTAQDWKKRWTALRLHTVLIGEEKVFNNREKYSTARYFQAKCRIKACYEMILALPAFESNQLQNRWGLLALAVEKESLH